jgi:hypothetical protein
MPMAVCWSMSPTMASIKAGHGLDNLHCRLCALYGGDAVLESRRNPSGVTVRLRVPAA